MLNYSKGRGSNSVQVRRYNERIILQTLRRTGQASKAELARNINLTNAAIGAIIQDLIFSGLIEEMEKRHDGARGQPATPLQLSPNGAFSFGVRLDRASTEIILVNFAGEVMGRRFHDIAPPEPSAAADMIHEDVKELTQLIEPDHRERIAGLGLAMPFNMEAWLRELSLPAEIFSRWSEVDFARQLENDLPFPVFFENDCNAAATAELFYGAGRKIDDFLYIYLGAAIGGGVVANGDCLRGLAGNAGDFAVIPVPASKLASAPKPKDDWDILITRASLSSLRRHLRRHDVNIQTKADLDRAIIEHRPAVEEWLEDCAEALAVAVWAAHALLDIPTLVIDADADQDLLSALIQKLAQALDARAPEARNAPQISRGSFGRDASAIGAATLPLFFNFSPRPSILTNARTGQPA